MSSEVQIVRRRDAQSRDAFDKLFSEIPQQIAQLEHRQNISSSPQLWLKLLAYGNHRNCEFWTAMSSKTGEPLARIGADIQKSTPQVGSIGFFDCRDSPEGHAAGQFLIRTALDWLEKSEVKNVVAPMDFNSWFNYRFKLREPNVDKEVDKVWEPTAPDFHRKLFLKCDFDNFLDFASLTYEVPSQDIWNAYLQKLRPDYESVTQTYGYQLRPFYQQDKLIEDLQSVCELSNLAFADNPMFEEIPFDIFREMMLGLAQKTNMSASRICTSSSGEIVGFAFCFSDKDELIYKTVAVHPAHRSKGIANAFTFEISDFCMRNNIYKTTGALIRSGNASEKIGQSHGQFAKPNQIHKYVLLQKALK